MKTRHLFMMLALGALGFAADRGIAQAADLPAAAVPTSPSGPAPGVISPRAVSPPSAPTPRSAAELERLAQPIALHPDPLIAILLPAAVYPLEIVQAARFVKNTNNLPSVDAQPWDENVKAVAKFPALIAQMDADLRWTIALGQAFLDQPKELMDTIQALRTKSHTAGTLRTTPQQVVTVTNLVVVETNVTQVVTVTNQIVEIQPANPQVVYVPTYTSTVYYPPPNYVYDPYAPLVGFGVGIAVGAIIANNCDWHGGGIYVGGGGMVIWGGGGYHGDVDIDIDNNLNINRGERPTPNSGNRAQNTGARPATQPKWQPDSNRLRTSGAPTVSTREARGWGSAATAPRPATPTAGAARPAPSTGAVGARPSAGTPGAARPSAGVAPSPRPSTGNAPAARPSVSPGGARPTPAPGFDRSAPTPSAPRPAPQPSFNRSAPSGAGGGTAFGGMNSGGASRNFSNRGAASRGAGGGGFRGGGGRGGGRR